MIIWLTGDLACVSGGAANVYLWRHGDEVTLVDAGLPGEEQRVLDALDELGLPSEAVTRIVLTHFHGDHVGGAAALAERCGARVAAGRDDADVVRGRRDGPPPVLSDPERELMASIGEQPATPPCRVDDELADGDRIGPLEIVAVPGHTPGSVAVWEPATRALVTGDVAVAFGPLALGPFNADPAGARRALRRLADLAPGAVGPGHGAPVTTGAAAALAAAADAAEAGTADRAF